MEIDMNIALPFVHCSVEELKALLDGGTLTVYSVARPITADRAVDRSGALATFTFASPAFGEASNGLENPVFVANPVPASHVGTPGDREIKFSEISCTQGAPVTLTKFKFIVEGGWPEKPEYYNTRPRSGFALPRSP
jgi:hypothetical protein